MAKIIQNINDDSVINIVTNHLQKNGSNLKTFERYYEFIAGDKVNASGVFLNTNPKIFFLNKVLTFYNFETSTRQVLLFQTDPIDSIDKIVYRGSISIQNSLFTEGNFLFNNMKINPTVASYNALTLITFAGYRLEIE